MKSVAWKTYRTRFLVQAKQLDAALSFVDSLGRKHCGRKGDYLVESSEGVLTITPRQIFEDIYVPMLGLVAEENRSAQLKHLPVQQLPVHEVRMPQPPLTANSSGRPSLQSGMIGPKDFSINSSVRVRRKLPQSFRDRRSPSSTPRMGLM